MIRRVAAFLPILVACAEPRASTLDSHSIVLVDEPAEADHRRTRLAAELCSKLECDDGTATRVREAVLRLPVAGRPDEVTSEMANSAFADAFRQIEFDAIVLDEYWTIFRPREESVLVARLEVLRDLHAVLGAPQRLQIATMIRKTGLTFLETVRTPDESQGLRAGRRWGLRICKWAECTTSQQQQVLAAVGEIDGARYERELASQHGKLSEAFASTVLTEALLDEFEKVTSETRAARRQQMDDVIVAIHHALSSAQRASVADQLEVVGVDVFGFRRDA